jgi:predicted TIM-barrel fold metal-dependent hydrolase
MDSPEMEIRGFSYGDCLLSAYDEQAKRKRQGAVSLREMKGEVMEKVLERSLVAGPGDSSRRNFLKGLAALGASALLPCGKLLAQTPPANPHAIDCHHHFASPAYLKALSAKQGHRVRGYSSILTWVGPPDGSRDYSPGKDVGDMSKQGVSFSFVSCTTPGIWFGDPEETRFLARDMNEFGAKMVSDYKGRFGLFALLPLPDSEDSLREIEYAFDTLHADGVGLLSSYGDHWLGDPIFRRVFEELNRRKAVVYVHPTDPPCCQDLGVGTEWNTDTARTIFSLLATGAATRYADTRFIFSHGGGTMPSLVGRFGIGGVDNIADILARPAEPNSRLYHLRRFYYDTAGSTNPVQMQGLKMVVGASRIVFGTDRLPDARGYSDGPAKHLLGLQKCGFTAQELQDIHRGNAERLFPRLKGNNL